MEINIRSTKRLHLLDTDAGIHTTINIIIALNPIVNTWDISALGVYVALFPTNLTILRTQSAHMPMKSPTIEGPKRESSGIVVRIRCSMFLVFHASTLEIDAREVVVVRR